MGRSKKKMKYSRVFHKTPESSEAPSASTPASSVSTPASSVSSSSEKKIAQNLNDYDFYDTDNKNFIIDIELFGKFLSEVVSCSSCGGSIKFDVVRRIGWAMQLQVNCENCTIKKKFSNSTIIKRNVEEKKLQMYEINLRLVNSFRAIGKGKEGAKIFSALMNLPPPPTKFGSYERALLDATQQVAETSMRNAVHEALLENEEEADEIPVAVNATWQKRGHVSQNGIVTATSVDTGKVVVVEALSKYCHCKNKAVHGPKCNKNFEGSSGAMEAHGAVEIFSRSVQKYGVKYTKFLCDGDSKAFLTLQSKKVYGEYCQVTKLECIGHVQKRMGSRLKALKLRSGKEKLTDVKSLGGKGRLTDTSILSIQKYYGYAIRNNLESVNKMKKAIWAEFFHIGSSDDEPNHFLCPEGEDSWCKFRRAEVQGQEYKHKNHFHLPYAVMMKIKPIFQDLANPELLKKCLHGTTQNANESFNQAIWLRISKNIFVQLRTLKLGLYDAVGCFNDGNISRCRVYEELGISPGLFCAEALKIMDQERIKKGNKDSFAFQIKKRQKRSRAKKKLEEEFDRAEEAAGPSYGAGLY